MAEQTLSELVMNLSNWIESLHEKNLKYEAQVESLSRDLDKALSSKKELEAQLSAYQNSDKNSCTSAPASSIGNPITPNIHPQHQQPIYQPIANTQAFIHQTTPYLWSAPYDTSGHDLQATYYDQYGTPINQP